MACRNCPIPRPSMHRGITARVADATADDHGETGGRVAFRGHLCCLPFLLAVAAANAQPPDAVHEQDDRVASVGSWDVVAAEWDGTQVDPKMLAMLKVVYQDDGAWAVLFKGMPLAAGRSINRQDRSPKTFEMETLGSKGIKPRRYAGIYRVAGDVRVLCIAPGEDPRPESFTAPRRSGRVLVTLKRTASP